MTAWLSLFILWGLSVQVNSMDWNYVRFIFIFHLSNNFCKDFIPLLSLFRMVIILWGWTNRAVSSAKVDKWAPWVLGRSKKQIDLAQWPILGPCPNSSPLLQIHQNETIVSDTANAFSRSIHTKPVYFFRLKLLVILSVSLTSWDTQECFFLNPNCSGGMRLFVLKICRICLSMTFSIILLQLLSILMGLQLEGESGGLLGLRTVTTLALFHKSTQLNFFWDTLGMYFTIKHNKTYRYIYFAPLRHQTFIK